MTSIEIDRAIGISQYCKFYIIMTSSSEVVTVQTQHILLMIITIWIMLPQTIKSKTDLSPSYKNAQKPYLYQVKLFYHNI